MPNHAKKVRVSKEREQTGFRRKTLDGRACPDRGRAREPKWLLYTEAFNSGRRDS